MFALMGRLVRLLDWKSRIDHRVRRFVLRCGVSLTLFATYKDVLLKRRDSWRRL